MLRRRNFLFGAASFLPVYAILAEAARATGRPSSHGAARRWISRQDEIARGLADGTISQTEWHDAISSLSREVDIPELVAEIGRARLIGAGAPFGNDPVKRYVKFIDEDGEPRSLGYGAATFSFTSSSVITPHAHRHMASAHLVVDGKIRIRTYDRIGEEGDALLLRPTRDEIAEAGASAAMTTARDNVHWFASRSESAMTFDVIISGLDAGEKDYLIEPVDPLGGEIRDDGVVLAPVISFEESAARYTVSL